VSAILGTTSLEALVSFVTPTHNILTLSSPASAILATTAPTTTATCVTNLAGLAMEPQLITAQDAIQVSV
jgi:hypothetical protein